MYVQALTAAGAAVKFDICSICNGAYSARHPCVRGLFICAAQFVLLLANLFAELSDAAFDTRTRL